MFDFIEACAILEQLVFLDIRFLAPIYIIDINQAILRPPAKCYNLNNFRLLDEHMHSLPSARSQWATILRSALHRGTRRV